MKRSEAMVKARELEHSWKRIVEDAFRHGFLTTELCQGCGKANCGSCPCGTYTGWDPRCFKALASESR